MVGKFKREGTKVYLWMIPVDVWQKPTKYYQAIILQSKIKKFFKRRKKTINLTMFILESVDGNTFKLQI